MIFLVCLKIIVNHAYTLGNNFDAWTKIRAWFFPTVHAFLGHTWELISNNDGNGFGSYSEAGLEDNNKVLRDIRRKSHQSENLGDCLFRLWLWSDLIIRR